MQQIQADDDNDVTYEWRDKGSKDRPAQHEIVRLLAGAKDIHRLAYTRRVAQLPIEDAEHWIGILRRAQLVVAAAPTK